MERRFDDAIGANSPLRQRRRGDRIAALFVAVHESGSGRFCCKSIFAAWDSNSQSHRRDDRIITWGTAPSCAKLTDDSDNGFEAALIGDCRLFRSLAENLPRCLLGLLQHGVIPGSSQTKARES